MKKWPKLILSGIAAFVFPGIPKGESPGQTSMSTMVTAKLCNAPTAKQRQVLDTLSKDAGVSYDDDSCPRLVQAIMEMGFITPSFRRTLGLIPINQHAPVILAHRWKPGQNIAGWWFSEKYDGVRAYWTGQEIVSRKGNVFSAPAWFTENLPPIPLDGELWIGRKRFSETLSIVRDRIPSLQWQKVRFLVFDAPSIPGGFEERLAQARRRLNLSHLPHVSLVEHQQIGNETRLLQLLADIEKSGGEGLMLRKPGSLYTRGRSHDLLKVKSHHDAEAIVIEHLPGKGRNAERMGSLLVELPDGARFRIGTGFSDEERENPPPLGSTIVFRYYGRTKTGLPRAASFLRIREEF